MSKPRWVACRAQGSRYKTRKYRVLFEGVKHDALKQVHLLKRFERKDTAVKKNLLLKTVAVILPALFCFNVAPVNAAPNVSAGTVTLSGTIYEDLNRNEVRDPGEPGIPGVYALMVVKDGMPLIPGMPLTNTTPPILFDQNQTKTDENGNWSVTLPSLESAGSYYEVTRVARLANPYDKHIGTNKRPNIKALADLTKNGAKQENMNFGWAIPNPEDTLVHKSGHGDLIYPEIDEGTNEELELKIRAKLDGGTNKILDLDKFVIQHDETVKRKTPDVYTNENDWSFIGPPGTPYYISMLAGGQYGSPWIGTSTEAASMRKHLSYDAPVYITLTAVTGLRGGKAPGDFIAWIGDTEKTGKRILWSTLVGLPKTSHQPLGAHTHLNWGFTAPGIYCLAYEVHTRTKNNQHLADRAILTHVVGDINAEAVPPCENTMQYPQIKQHPVTSAEPDTPQIIRDGETGFNFSLNADETLAVNFDHTSKYVNTLKTRHKIDDVIIYDAYNTNRDLHLRDYMNRLTVDSTDIRLGELSSDIKWRITDVKGPGELKYMSGYAKPLFDTSTAEALNIWPAAGAPASSYTPKATKPGKYCIAMQWETKTDSGKTISDSHILTYVKDGPTDNKPEKFDQTTFKYQPTGKVWLAEQKGALDKTCAQDPNSYTRTADVDESTQAEPEKDKPWQVPNWSETASGAKILNLGHIDIASVLSNGKLDTKIKDTTDEGATAGKDTNYTYWHKPENVVLQLLPEAEERIPAENDYRFLGRAGTKIWSVHETQDQGLLWPGWSTQDIPQTSTYDGVTWQLKNMQGPGNFFLYQRGTFGSPTKIHFNTADGINQNDTMEIPNRAHVHGSWSFTKQGTYCLTFLRKATIDGKQQESPFKLAVAVGKTNPRTIDPTNCQSSTQQPTAGHKEAEQIDTTKKTAAHKNTLPSTGSSTNPTPAAATLLLLAGGILLLSRIKPQRKQ